MDSGAEDQPATRPIFPMLRWLIPVHALLPVLIAGLVARCGEFGAALVSWGWLLVHLGFPIFLGLSYPWWRGRGDEVAAVVVINHVVTFTVGVALLSWWSSGG